MLLCRQRGYAPTWCVGVVATPPFAAHAWIEADDRIVDEPIDASYLRTFYRVGACARALRAGGGRVLGALTLSAAPPPAHARISVPTGPSRQPRDDTASALTMDPEDLDLSACGDQEGSSGRGAHEREA